jgi:hypothetical protein
MRLPTTLALVSATPNDRQLRYQDNAAIRDERYCRDDRTDGAASTARWLAIGAAINAGFGAVGVVPCVLGML